MTDDRPVELQLLDFMDIARGKVLEAMLRLSPEERERMEIAIIVRVPSGVLGGFDYWQHIRTIPRDELEDFYEAARENVATMDMDPTHVEHAPIDLTIGPFL